MRWPVAAFAVPWLAHLQPLPTPPSVNLADVEFQPRAAPVTGAAGARYEAAFARVGAPVGARRLGYTMTAVPPGKRAFPFHSHRVNEEILRSRGDR